jgi:hypothetical protein
MGVFRRNELERENELLRAENEMGRVLAGIASTLIDHQHEQLSKARALLADVYAEFVEEHGDADAVREYADRLREVGVEVRA